MQLVVIIEHLLIGCDHTFIQHCVPDRKRVVTRWPIHDGKKRMRLRRGWTPGINGLARKRSHLLRFYAVGYNQSAGNQTYAFSPCAFLRRKAGARLAKISAATRFQKPPRYQMAAGATAS